MLENVTVKLARRTCLRKCKLKFGFSTTSQCLTTYYRSALNMIVAFACSVKHKLRFEPGIDYDDLKERIGYLDTFARAAEADIPKQRQHAKVKAVGEYLGVSFAESNPRKRVKQSKKPLGNLPLEILNHLSAYVHSICDNETLKIGLYQNQASKFIPPTLNCQDSD